MYFDNDARLPQERLSAIGYGILALSLLLLSGFWKLQIIDTERYAEMAERNRIRSLPILAPRGRILDREGRDLVTSYPSFSVRLIRENAEVVEKKLPEIAEGIGVTVEQIREKLEQYKSLPRFYPIEIKAEFSGIKFAGSGNIKIFSESNGRLVCDSPMGREFARAALCRLVDQCRMA